MSILQDRCAFQINVHVDSFDSKNYMFLALIINIYLFRAGGCILFYNKRVATIAKTFLIKFHSWQYRLF